MIKKSSAAKGIVKRLKDRELGSEKANVTYRLTKSVVEHFKVACEKEGVVPGQVLEEFMKDFIDQVHGGRKG